MNARKQQNTAEDLLKLGLFAAGALAVGWATTRIFRMKDDNLIEEAAEEVIRRRTGLNIDITPNSRERRV